MSATVADTDFYQNLLEYMNQNGPNPFLTTIDTSSFLPHETEKHSLDEAMKDINDPDPKRRESTNSQVMDSGSDEPETKPKKKPGRKMIEAEPANKRKAQNRAAQRAFRERKEAHVKGLESRVTELEELTKSKDAENEKLKSQVEALQAELMAIRGQKFDFDFNMSNVQNTMTDTAPVRNPFQNKAQPNGQQSSPSPSSGSGSVTDSSLFRSGRSSLATSPENEVNKNATPNIDIPFDLFSSSSGPLTFTNPSTQPSPLFNTDLFNNNSPAQSNVTSTPLFGQNQPTSPVLDTFAQTLASLTKQNQSPMSNNFNSSNVPPPSSTVPMSIFSSESMNLFNLNDPLFNNWRDTSAQGTMDDNSFDIFDTMFPAMSPGPFLMDNMDLTTFITDSPVSSSSTPSIAATGEKGITCPELWEQVRNHPQFDEIDIDQLCAEMKNKAKCSSSGPVVTARDVDETISRMIKN